MDEGADLVAQSADGWHRLNCANLIVEQHYRHEQHVVGQPLLQNIETYETLVIDREVLDLEAESSGGSAGGSEHALVLDRANEDASPSSSATRRPEYGKVICLGGTGGEDDLVRISPNRR
jgi:hypothetical protein